MSVNRLRVYPPQEEAPKPSAQAPNVSIRLVDLYPLLAQAYQDNYLWLRDFEEDEVLVSADLFEVVRAFSNGRSTA